jgi:type III secretion protein T
MVEQVPVLGENLFKTLPWLDQMLLVSVSSARFAFVFLFVPLFSQQVMPATVRNSIIITFGLVAYVLHTDFMPKELGAWQWATMLFKEAAAGVIIGFFFGSIFWAMSSAGELIDTKVGATMGQLVDPFSGSQTSLTGILLGRFAQIVFVMGGGLTLLVGTVMESYVIWPMGPGPMELNFDSIQWFENEFGRMFYLTFLLASPILTILYVIDLGMGFLNRFAQQFNVFSLSMPIKGAAAILLLVLMLPMMANIVTEDMRHRNSISSEMLRTTATDSTQKKSEQPKP